MKDIIYLDNAATTSLDPAVLEEMLPLLTEHFGNPSSTYSLGRKVKSQVESARRKIAATLGVKPQTLYFTSGGTESNNTAIASAVYDLGCTHIITSAIEHHAVLHTVKHYCKEEKITFSYVNILANGEVDLSDLEKQLAEKQLQGVRTLVTLMHANNEIGSILDIRRAGQLCKQFNAIFHSDCVQTVGHYPLDLSEYGVDFISASGHKFHGPKGSGLLYVREGTGAGPLLHGGSQERNMRAGTENVSGIVGLAKALEIAMTNYEKESAYIQHINNYMREKLIATVPGISFNNPASHLYTILSACFPVLIDTEMLLMYLDMAGVCASGGSACSSGEEGGSHVLNALGRSAYGAHVRFSFSKHTTEAEIDLAVALLATIIAENEQRLTR